MTTTAITRTIAAGILIIFVIAAFGTFALLVITAPPPACSGNIVTHYEMTGRPTGYTCLPHGVNYSASVARETAA